LIRDQIKMLPVSGKNCCPTQIRTLRTTLHRGIAHISLEIQRAPLSAAERVVKRAIDISIGLLALVFFIQSWLLPH